MLHAYLWFEIRHVSDVYNTDPLRLLLMFSFSKPLKATPTRRHTPLSTNKCKKFHCLI